jgi:hypothetical protein
VNWLSLRRTAAAVSSLALLAASAGEARAQDRLANESRTEAPDDHPSHDVPREEVGPGLSQRIRGSTFLFDQSLSTQTAQLESGSPQQSYVPLYEWWLSLRPRYWFGDHFSVWGRLDFYKELTNSQPTTLAHEDLFGDVWTGGSWRTLLGPRKLTKLDLGVLALWPTSKVSQGAGIYVTAGASAGVTQKIPLRPSPILGEAHAGLGLTYQHPFSRATTAVPDGSFGYVRQDADAHSFVSDQLSGTMLAEHRLITTLDSGLRITPKLSWTLDMILIDEWHYAPTDATVQTGSGPVTVPSNSGATTFTQSTWFLTSFDYALLDEVSLGLGYYNLANVVAPDGQRRGLFGANNIWWSPDARVFFDVTVNLDAIWGDVDRRSEATKQAAREARLKRIDAGNGTGAP